MSALYDFDIWNGLSIFKQRDDDSIELWGFAANREAEKMQNFYVENIDLLKDFTASFNLNASTLIEPKNHNLAIYKNFKPEYGFDEYDSIKISEFINATPINKHPLITSGREIFLSTKELNCLNLLASGKSLKQIAKKIGISPRTSEKHFDNIKRKLGSTNKATIIEVYKENVFNWL